MSKTYLMLNGETLEKARRLNPYKRLGKGTEVTVTVDGEGLVAVIDAAYKYTYLNVGGVDYYVSAALIDGAAYTTEIVEVAGKKAKKVKAAEAEGDPEGGNEAVTYEPLGEGTEGSGEEVSEPTPEAPQRRGKRSS